MKQNDMCSRKERLVLNTWLSAFGLDGQEAVDYMYDLELRRSGVNAESSEKRESLQQRK